MAMYHGAEGLQRIAGRVHALTRMLAARLEAGGLELCHRNFFDTLAVSVPGRSDEILRAAEERGINLRRIGADKVGIAVSETTELGHLDTLLARGFRGRSRFR